MRVCAQVNLEDGHVSQEKGKQENPRLAEGAKALGAKTLGYR